MEFKLSGKLNMAEPAWRFIWKSEEIVYSHDTQHREKWQDARESKCNIHHCSHNCCDNRHRQCSMSSMKQSQSQSWSKLLHHRGKCGVSNQKHPKSKQNIQKIPKRTIKIKTCPNSKLFGQASPSLRASACPWSWPPWPPWPLQASWPWPWPWPWPSFVAINGRSKSWLWLCSPPGNQGG